MKSLSPLFSILLAFIFSTPIQADEHYTLSARQEIQANPNLSGGNPFTYPEPLGVKYTRPPRGYKPFHINAYLRHGSRFHWARNGYSAPLEILQKAQHSGKLTPTGLKVYQIVDSLARAAEGRIGELTQIGALQHQGIARRMVDRYPEIFRKDVIVTARSSTVVRCTLSMFNECTTLAGLCPQAIIQCDASLHDMNYIYDEDTAMTRYRNLPAVKDENLRSYNQYIQPDRLMKTLFNDTAYISRHIDGRNLAMTLFSLANHVQNHDVWHDAHGRNPQLDLFRFFTDDEIYHWALHINYYNYLHNGFSPLSENKLPLTRQHLLRNMIETADTCLASPHPNVLLRFGHDMVLMPLACLLQLGQCGISASSPEELITHWRNYRIFPMASNIQMVFYRRKGHPVLVKFLLNERETTIPLPSATAPYYKWDDVRAFYMNFLKSPDR